MQNENAELKNEYAELKKEYKDLMEEFVNTCSELREERELNKEMVRDFLMPYIKNNMSLQEREQRHKRVFDEFGVKNIFVELREKDEKIADLESALETSKSQVEMHANNAVMYCEKFMNASDKSLYVAEKKIVDLEIKIESLNRENESKGKRIVEWYDKCVDLQTEKDNLSKQIAELLGNSFVVVECEGDTKKQVGQVGYYWLKTEADEFAKKMCLENSKCYKVFKQVSVFPKPK